MTDIIQGSTEWLSLRSGKVTASKIADVMAKGKGNAESLTRAKYRDKLVAERLTGVYESGYTNEAIQRGTEMEPIARHVYAFDHGHVEQIAFVDHPTIEMAGASPDGLVGEDGLWECKCPNSSTHVEYVLAGKVPSKYIPQMAFQLACTGRKWVDFMSYDDRIKDQSKQSFIIRYERDDEYIELIEHEVRKFLYEVDAKVNQFLNA